MSKQPIEVLLDQVNWVAIPEASGRVAESGQLPHATHEGVLWIGDIGLRCYLLNNGQRIIEESDFMAFMMGAEMHRCLICGRDFAVSKEAARLAREHGVEIGCTPCMRKTGLE